MTLGNKIAQLRKAQNITQEALAQKLDVTNQAVSKWESDQCCPDIQLLPKLADIFGVTVDELFDREVPPQAQIISDLPWPDDNILRAILYVGHHMVCREQVNGKLTLRYKGDVKGVDSDIAVQCGNVKGDVDAGTSVTCGNVGGSVDAGTSVQCSEVAGDVDAGTDVHCTGDVHGSVDAGCSVTCGNVDGDVDAGTTVICQDISGSVDAGVSVTCCNVDGDVDAVSVHIKK